jgi:hypothetical protein
MKIFLSSSCLVAFLLFTAAWPITSRAEQSSIGGYAATSVTNKEVLVAAAYAVKAQQDALHTNKNAAAPKLELVTIVGAEEQVVAGINYRLQLKVKLNGREKTAEAVVWWQAWRKPDPHVLTSWKWK